VLAPFAGRDRKVAGICARLAVSSHTQANNKLTIAANPKKDAPHLKLVNSISCKSTLKPTLWANHLEVVQIQSRFRQEQLYDF
jgi:hypothetical protein